MPTVMTHQEATKLISYLEGTHRLIAKLLYGSGLRAREALSLRIKDLDFESQQIGVRNGKGNSDRFTLLPASVADELKQQIERVRRLHAYDLSCGRGEVALPDALVVKYPKAATQFKWQFLFPASRPGVDPRTGEVRRHHRHYSSMQRAVKQAVRRAKLNRHVTSHTFRHSFATRLIETGYDIKLVQSLLGHRDISTTEIYLHVVRNRAGAIVSPVDQILNDV
ncbi:MAG: integron integrase [Pseudomonadota bacterium]